MLLRYIWWDDWPIFMISRSNEQLQQELEYTLLKPYCHSWWISKMESGREDNMQEEWYAIKFCFKHEKMQQKRMECFRLLLEEPSTLQIGLVAFLPGQSTSPQLHPGHRQFLTVPIVQTLLPITFGYSLNSKAVVIRQLRRWKRLWLRSLTRSEKRTSIRLSRSCWNGTTSALQAMEITSRGTRVSCVY